MSTETRSLKTVVLCYLGCFLFPVAVMALVLTYEQHGNEPAPWPYRAVDDLFFADLGYTILLIWLMRGWRKITSWVSIPLLFLTAAMVSLADMWFTGNYL